MDHEIKVLNTRQLLRINKASIEARRNRTLNPTMLKRLVDPEGVHVISSSSYPHNDVEMRCLILVKTQGDSEPNMVFLDMSFEDYGNLKPFTDYQEVLNRE